MGYWQQQLQNLERTEGYNHSNPRHREISAGARNEAEAARQPSTPPRALSFPEQVAATHRRYLNECAAADARLAETRRWRGY